MKYENNEAEGIIKMKACSIYDGIQFFFFIIIWCQEFF